MDFGVYKNIEEWFLHLEVSEFPDNKPYPQLYSVIKKKMDDGVHNEIKTIALSYIPSEYLNDHGTKHVATVIDRASMLLKNSDFDLSPYETFLLLMGIQFHDAGHIINGRKEHGKTAAKVISEVVKDDLDSSEIIFINKIAKAHSGKDDLIGKMLEKDHFLGVNCRLRLLSAIVRISDELADDCLRASSFLLTIDSGAINERSKIFHIYSKRLKSCIVSARDGKVEQKFTLSEEDIRDTIKTGDGEKYIIDDIFERAKKTFTELVYCNRFLPEILKITRLNITIEFYNEENEEIFSPLILSIEEKGYPDLRWDTVHDICENMILSDGRKIDGAYLQTKLLSL